MSENEKYYKDTLFPVLNTHHVEKKNFEHYALLPRIG